MLKTMMKERYLIGELAKMFNVSRQTLRHYDKLGLLKPEIVDPENQYRYYSIRQIMRLESITIMRAEDFSLEEIAEFFQTTNMEEKIKQVKRQEEALEKKIAEWSQIKKRMSFYRDYYGRQLDSNPVGVVQLRYFNQRHLYRLELKKKDFIYACMAHKFLDLSEFYEEFSSEPAFHFAGIIKKERILENEPLTFDEIAYLFKQHPEKENLKLKAIPSGNYVTLVYTGEYEKRNRYYDILKEWIQAHNFTINGDATEISIIEPYFSEQPQEWITEIQIPIK